MGFFARELVPVGPEWKRSCHIVIPSGVQRPEELCDLRKRGQADLELEASSELALSREVFEKGCGLVRGYIFEGVRGDFLLLR